MSQPEYKNDDKEFIDAVKEYGRTGAVLLGDHIEYLVKKYDLITFENGKDDYEQIKAASCRLTVGSKYQKEKKRHKLVEIDDDFDIPPFEVAIIETREVLKMPRNLIGRWNIKVGLAYEGLLWVGGPQVDPGYEGHLYCPIYNLSNKPVNLRKGQEIAVIDFVVTTEYNHETNYKFKQKRIDFYDYPILESALALDMKHRVDEIEKGIEGLRKDFDTKTENMYSRLFSIVGPIITTLSLLFALFAIFVTSLGNVGAPSEINNNITNEALNPPLFSVNVWIYILAIMNFGTLLIVLSRDLRSRSWMKKYGNNILFIITIIAFVTFTYFFLFH